MPRLIREIDVEDEDLGIKEYSAVDRPATGISFRMFKGDQTKPAEVEECVQSVLSDPDFTGGEERAWAICQAQHGKGGTNMPRKQEELPEVVEDVIEGEGMPKPTGVVEIPTSPARWPIGQCIETAMDQGYGRDDSIGLCQMVAQTYGDPEDPDTVMLPEGTTPEGLLNQLAVDHGVAKPQGTAGTPEMTMSEDGKSMPGSGLWRKKPIKNYWVEKYKEALGIQGPTPAEQVMFRLAKEVSQVRQAQSKAEKRSEDLMQIINATLGIIARSQGIDPATLPVPAAAVETPADDPEAPDEATPDAPEGGEKNETPEEELARLRADNARLQAIVSGQAPSEEGDGGEATPNAGGGGTEEIQVPAAAAYTGMYIGGDEVPSDAPDPIQKPGMPEEPQKRGRPQKARASVPVDSTKRAGRGDTMPLTLCGGAVIDRDDLRALGWDKI